MTAAKTVLKLEHVSKKYETPGGKPLTVLNDVSLSISAGDSVAVAGPSGSGKSTFLNLLGALDRPTSGRILLGGEDLSRMDEKRLARLRNREIGFVFQMHHLLPQLSVLENVLVPLVARSSAKDPGTVERARALLERVGLLKRETHRPFELSGGEKVRVALVRALINRPGLLLADEPTGSLDRNTSREIASLLLELNRESGCTLVVATHSLELAGAMNTRYELLDARVNPQVKGHSE